VRRLWSSHRAGLAHELLLLTYGKTHLEIKADGGARFEDWPLCPQRMGQGIPQTAHQISHGRIVQAVTAEIEKASAEVDARNAARLAGVIFENWLMKAILAAPDKKEIRFNSPVSGLP